MQRNTRQRSIPLSVPLSIAVDALVISMQI